MNDKKTEVDFLKDVPLNHELLDELAGYVDAGDIPWAIFRKIAEAAYRRGYQQGAHQTLSHGYNQIPGALMENWINKTLHSWRYETPLDHPIMPPALNLSLGQPDIVTIVDARFTTVPILGRIGEKETDERDPSDSGSRLMTSFRLEDLPGLGKKPASPEKPEEGDGNG